MKCVLNSQMLAVRKSEIACEMQNPNEMEMSLKAFQKNYDSPIGGRIRRQSFFQEGVKPSRLPIATALLLWVFPDDAEKIDVAQNSHSFKMQ